MTSIVTALERDDARANLLCDFVQRAPGGVDGDVGKRLVCRAPLGQQPRDSRPSTFPGEQRALFRDTAIRIMGRQILPTSIVTTADGVVLAAVEGVPTLSEVRKLMVPAADHGGR